MVLALRKAKRKSRPAREPSRLRFGVLLGVLALFSQMVVAALPMRASAATPWSSICSVDEIVKSGQNQHQPPVHTDGSCPVCLALHLAGNTLPPPDAAIAAPLVVAAELPATSVIVRIVDRSPLGPQQARAPPNALTFSLT